MRPLFIDLPATRSYRFFAFLAFLAAFFAFFAIDCIPPFRLGYASGFAAPPAVASAAWHSARGSRLSCALLRVSRGRAMWRKGGAVLDNRPW